MIARFRSWFEALTTRERGMVSLAFGLALAIALAQGVVVPLCHAWLAARDAHAVAMAHSARLLRQLAETPPRAPIPPRPDAARLLVSAARAGVQLAPPLARSGGLALAGHGPGAAVLAWLDSLRDQGLIVRRLTLAPLPAGGISCEANVAPAGASTGLSIETGVRPTCLSGVPPRSGSGCEAVRQRPFPSRTTSVFPNPGQLPAAALAAPA